jgi:hypothetical protein
LTSLIAAIDLAVTGVSQLNKWRNKTMNQPACRCVVLPFLFACISNGLYAVDGVELIDMRRVMAGRVTPGDTPGFPVTISQPGSYRLTDNITVPDTATTGFDITADNVTVDLNGFSIIGPNVCTPNPTRCTASGGGVGIHAGSFSPGIVAPDGVKVMNGTVRGMGFHGVRLMGNATVVERVHTHSNGGPGIVVGPGSVVDSVANLNGTTGIIGFLVRGSIAQENGGVGIFLRSGGLASDNASLFNGGEGINVTKGTLTGNTVTSNKGFGISATCPGSIVGNTAVDNLLGNIRALGVCTLANNAQ